MVRAWNKSNSGHIIKDSEVTEDEILKEISLAGVELWKVKNGEDESLRREYIARFDITLTSSVETNKPPGNLNQKEYEAELARYMRPHFHFTDEVRHIKDGACYIDIQIGDEKWARLRLSSGDVILIPAGVFHCVTLDEAKFVKASGFYRSRGLDDEYLPRYSHDVKSLIKGRC